MPVLLLATHQMNKLFQSNIKESLKHPSASPVKKKVKNVLNDLKNIKTFNDHLQNKLKEQNVNPIIEPFVSKILDANPDFKEKVKSNPSLLKIFDNKLLMKQKQQLLKDENIEIETLEPFIKNKVIKSAIEIASPFFKLS